MEAAHTIIQLVIGLGILNVWFLRPGKSTPFRGGNATTLREEFSAYGLPVWAFYAVGTIKVSAALALLGGIWFPVLVQPAALVMATLMLGAVAMHIRVRDPLKKSLPAATLLILSLFLLNS